MNYEQIAVERDEGVLVITLNRPEVLNALTQVMSDELVDAFEGAGADPGVRAVLLTGAGRGFCAGQDLLEFEADYREGRKRDVREHLERTYHRLIPRIVESPVPVVAAVNGVAAGAGVSLAVACDIRIASDSARFTQAFVKIGLIPDSGGTFLLPRVVGYAKALELSLTGDMIDAAEAERIGLVSAVHPPGRLMEEARAVAGRLARMPTLALGAAKRLIREASNLDLEPALEAEAALQDEMAGTADHVEGVNAFAEKREPKFRGR